MNSREQFEESAKSMGLSVTRTDKGLAFHNGTRRAAGDYIDLLTLVSWHFWQASRQALEIVLPEPFPLGDGYGLGLDPEDTRAAIEAAGVRVKP